jgi:hypothetical protein
LLVYDAVDGGGELPEAGARVVGADRAHRRGHTGRGVRIGLCDSGVGARAYFDAKAARIEGRRTRHDGHGTAMAAVLFAIAPDATVVSAPAGSRALAALVRRADIDLVLCAWGRATTPAGVQLDQGPPIVAADVGLAGIWPAHADGVTAVADAGGRPSYHLPGGRRLWAGASVRAAEHCGLAALAVGAGQPPREAVQRAAPLDLLLLDLPEMPRVPCA